MAELDVSLRLKADGSGLVGEVRNSRAEVDKFATGLDKAGKTAARSQQGYTTAAKGVRSISEQLARARKELLAFLGVTALLTGLRKLINLADGYTLINARLRLVTRSTEEYALAQTRLLAIAQSTRSALDGTVDTYSRLARSTRELGLSQFQLLAVTETINQAIAVSGATAQSAQAALFQLGQGFASGALRGEELNSVLEQTPRLAEAIAAGMGKTIGELRQMGADGELTAARVVQALLDQRAAIEREFNQMPVTVGQALTKAGNAITEYIGRTDEAIGASSKLAGAISALADNVTLLGEAIFTVIEIALLLFGGRLIASFAKGRQAVTATTGSVKSLSAATSTAVDIMRFGLVVAVVALAAPLKTAKVAGIATGRAIAGGMAASATATWAAVTAAGALSTAWSLAIAAFAGWEIGSWLRDNFVQARVAGLAFVGAMVNGWERLQFVGQAMWEAIKATGQSAIRVVKAALSSFLATVAAGLDKIGAEETAARLQGLADGLRSPGEAANQFESRLADLRSEMERNIEANDVIIQDLVNYELHAKKATDATDELADANNNLNNTVTKLTANQEALLDALFPDAKAFDDYNDALNELAKIQQTLGWTDGEFQDAVDRLTEAYLGLGNAAKEVTVALDPAAAELAQIYEDTASSIRQSFRDTFRDVLDDGIDGFKDMAKRIESLFKDMLADLLTLAIARPIIVPVVASVGNALGVNGAAQAGVLNQLGGAALPGVPGTGGIPGLSSVGQLLGPAGSLLGIGALGGGLVSQLTGGNAVGGSIGGAAGLYGGVLAGSGALGGVTAGAVGALGQLGNFVVPGLGLLAGAALGSLIGNKKPSDRAQGGVLDLASGKITTSGQGGKKFSQENADFRDQVLSNASAIAQLLQQQTGGQLNGQLKAVIGSRDGLRFGFGGQLTNVGNDAQALVSGISKGLVDSLTGVSAELKNVLTRVDFSNLQQAQGDIAFAKAFLSGELFDTQSTNEAEQAVKALNTQFDAVADTARRLGLSVATAEAQRRKAIQSLRDEFTSNVRAEIQAIENPFQAALNAQKEAADLYLQTARTLQVDLTDVKRRNQLQLSQLVDQYLEPIDALLNQVTLSSLTPAQQLTSLQSDFSAAANANNLPELAQIAGDLIRLGQDAFASGPEFQTLIGDINDTLSAVKERLGVQGSFASGLPFVPYDGFVGELHRGEAVVDAGTMRALRRYGISGAGNDAGQVTQLLKQLIAVAKENGSASIKVVTPDGRTLKEETLRDLLRRSQSGEIVVDARGVAA